MTNQNGTREETRSEASNQTASTTTMTNTTNGTSISKPGSVRRLSVEQKNQPQNQEFWVFGYGSLVWNPGFNYSESRVGFITGYKRRFWQGNDVQRGTPDQMGRVVTLIEDEQAVTWGRAFRLIDEASARMYLDHRESSLGGYTTIITSFHAQDSRDPPISVLVYIALPTNPLYLGETPLQTIAEQIAKASGICGHNVEYLAKLAAFMRLNLPNVKDDHLYKLESLVQSTLKQSNQSQAIKLFDDAFKELLNIFNNCPSKRGQNGTHNLDDLIEIDYDDNLQDESLHRFVDTVPTRKLRFLAR